MTYEDDDFEQWEGQAPLDAEVSRLIQRGVPSETAAALAPALSSPDMRVYLDAVRWAEQNGVIGNDLSDEGHMRAAQTVAAAEQYVAQQRARFGDEVVPDLTGHRERYDPSDEDDVQNFLDERHGNMQYPGNYSGTEGLGQSHEPPALELHDTSPVANSGSVSDSDALAAWDAEYPS